MNSPWSLRLPCWLLLPLLLAGLALVWQTNRDHLCGHQEWLHEAFCPAQEEDPVRRIENLRRHLHGNPGDAQSWIKLAVEMSQGGHVFPPEAKAVIAMASKLAPNDPRVRQLLVRQLLDAGQWVAAVDALVYLVQQTKDRESAGMLAMLLQVPQARDAMVERVTPGAPWLEILFSVIGQSKMSPVFAMPLAHRVVELNGLTPAMARSLITPLKQAGHWNEAYALWLAWQGGSVSQPFNGSFDHGFMLDGFDWELGAAQAARSGVRVEQPEVAGRGRVLEVEFVGRGIPNPVIRQSMLLLQSRYTLRGEYQSAGLRTRDGVAWSLHCVHDGREVARSAGLGESAGQWVAFEIDIAWPAACGMAAVLQLQALSSYEAVAGMRGRILFDNLRLEPRP